MLNTTLYDGIEKLILTGKIEVPTEYKTDTLNAQVNAYLNGKLSVDNLDKLGKNDKLTTEEAFVVTMLKAMNAGRQALDISDNSFTTDDVINGYEISGSLTEEQKVFQGLVNLKEFVAELTSNGKFIQFLDEVPFEDELVTTKVHKRTVLETLKDIVKTVLNKIFGMEFNDRNVAFNALTSVMVTMEKTYNTNLKGRNDKSIPRNTSEEFKKNQEEIRKQREEEFKEMFPDNQSEEELTEENFLNDLMNISGTSKLRDKLISKLNVESTIEELIKDDRLIVSCKL